jgi:uncharacterized protein YjiS (DUF1127 family)
MTMVGNIVRHEPAFNVAGSFADGLVAGAIGNVRPESIARAAAAGPDGPADPGSLIDSWRKRIRLRRHLARLLVTDPGLIEDIGFSLEEAERELRKPFWRH